MRSSYVSALPKSSFILECCSDESLNEVITCTLKTYDKYLEITVCQFRVINFEDIHLPIIVNNHFLYQLEHQVEVLHKSDIDRMTPRNKAQHIIIALPHNRFILFALTVGIHM